jgi:hypothetical protein
MNTKKIFEFKFYNSGGFYLTIGLFHLAASVKNEFFNVLWNDNQVLFLGRKLDDEWQDWMM